MVLHRKFQDCVLFLFNIEKKKKVATNWGSTTNSCNISLFMDLLNSLQRDFEQSIILFFECSIFQI